MILVLNFRGVCFLVFEYWFRFFNLVKVKKNNNFTWFWYWSWSEFQLQSVLVSLGLGNSLRVILFWVWYKSRTQSGFSLGIGRLLVGLHTFWLDGTPAGGRGCLRLIIFRLVSGMVVFNMTFQSLCVSKKWMITYPVAGVPFIRAGKEGTLCPDILVDFFKNYYQ